MENMTQSTQVYTSHGTNGQEPAQPPVSMGKWIGIMCINLIPIVGPLVYFIMLFIWAFGDNNKDKTFKNWAKAQLVFSLIGVVLLIIGGLLFGGLIIALISQSAQMPY